MLRERRVKKQRHRASREQIRGKQDKGCSEWFGTAGVTNIWVCPALLNFPKHGIFRTIPVKPEQLFSLRLCSLTCVQDLGRRHGESRKITALNILKILSADCRYEHDLGICQKCNSSRHPRPAGEQEPQLICPHIRLRKTALEDSVRPGWHPSVRKCNTDGKQREFLAVIWLMTRSTRF